MVRKLPQEFRRYRRNRNQLRYIFKETQRVLEIVTLENFFPEENIIEELLPSLTVDRLNYNLYNNPSIVVCGQYSKSKAALVNNLLSTNVLPVCDGLWRWIKFVYGHANHVSLTLGLDYEVLERVRANEKSWSTLPIEDLTRSGNEDINCPTILELKLDRSMLKDGVQIFVVPDVSAVRLLSKGNLSILPIFLYALSDYALTDENIAELRELLDIYPYNPVMFVSSLVNISHNSYDAALTESEQHRMQRQSSITNLDYTKNQADTIAMEKNNSLGLTWMDQLSALGFLRVDDSLEVDPSNWMIDGRSSNSSEIVDSGKKIDRILYFFFF